MELLDAGRSDGKPAHFGQRLTFDCSDAGQLNRDATCSEREGVYKSRGYSLFPQIEYLIRQRNRWLARQPAAVHEPHEPEA